jgi:outer membrane biosynthesis protein TonB
LALRILLLALALALSVAVPLNAVAETNGIEAESEDRDAQPIKAPRPSYPALAIRAQMPGWCDVRFDVNRQGYPTNIAPWCSHWVFCQSAYDAVASVRFQPKMLNGQPVPRSNVVYPLEYTIGVTEEERAANRARIEGKPGRACMADTIS